MQTIDLKNRIQNYIDHADERVLRIVNSVFENYFADTDMNIVAYSAKGEPLTKKMYIERLERASASIDAGNFLTMEELEKEAETWE